MSILAGGAYAAGGFANDMALDSPPGGGYVLNQWAHLVPDPLGRPYQVLRCNINQLIGTTLGTASSHRSEPNHITTASQWGAEYTYYWRFVIPPEWVNYGPSMYAIVLQIHDVDSAGISRNPPVLGTIINNILTITTTRHEAGVLTTTDVASLLIVPGQEVEIFIRAKWADNGPFGTPTGKVDPSQGTFYLSINGQQVYSLVGHQNTFDCTSPADANPPYLKAGIYNPRDTDSWWQGKDMSMYHVASAVGDASETVDTIRAYVNAQLSASDAFVHPSGFGYF